ncbi:hypothetical protein TWF696_002606 [Orbilia brochopaga]|uniref:Serine hydrolase domain-containing protein n=1 Tax=Orbilia brochopaga TaxID=3140254 RepID=A0AAV9U389_9PEZI
MRFLCLHGLGTNSKVFETQTAAIRAELGDGHTYDFVEGTKKWEKAPELGSLFSNDDDYFAYFDPRNPSEIYKAIMDLEKFIEAEGPFDGVIAFSQGASLVSSLLIKQGYLNGSATEKAANYFKCAIFIAAGSPISLDALQRNEVELLTEGSELRIYIPTAHIWATNDPVGPAMSAVLQALCAPQVRHAYVHNEGHIVPGTRSPDSLRAAVNVIRRVIWDVNSASS